MTVHNFNSRLIFHHITEFKLIKYGNDHSRY